MRTISKISLPLRVIQQTPFAYACMQLESFLPTINGYSNANYTHIGILQTMKQAKAWLDFDVTVKPQVVYADEMKDRIKALTEKESRMATFISAVLRNPGLDERGIYKLSQEYNLSFPEISEAMDRVAVAKFTPKEL